MLFFTPQICTDAKRDRRVKRRRDKGQDGNTKETQSHPHSSTPKLLQLLFSLHHEGCKAEDLQGSLPSQGALHPWAVPKPDWLQGLGPGQALSALILQHLQLWQTRHHAPDPPHQCYRGQALSDSIPLTKIFLFGVSAKSQTNDQDSSGGHQALLGRQSQRPWLSPPHHSQLPRALLSPSPALAQQQGCRTPGMSCWEHPAGLGSPAAVSRTHRLALARPARGSSHHTTLPGLSTGNTTATPKYQPL